MLITYSSITIFYFVMLGFVLNATEIKPVKRNIKALLVTILLLAFIVRVYAFNKLPNLDLDEAMGGLMLGHWGSMELIIFIWLRTLFTSMHGDPE